MKLKIIFKYSLMILMTVIIILLFSIVIRAFVLNSFALMARAFSNVTSEDYKMILVVFISLFIILTHFSFVFLIKMKRKILKIIYVTAIYFAAMVCSVHIVPYFFKDTFFINVSQTIDDANHFKEREEIFDKKIIYK